MGWPAGGPSPAGARPPRPRPGPPAPRPDPSARTGAATIPNSTPPASTDVRARARQPGERPGVRGAGQVGPEGMVRCDERGPGGGRGRRTAVVVVTGTVDVLVGGVEVDAIAPGSETRGCNPSSWGAQSTAKPTTTAMTTATSTAVATIQPCSPACSGSSRRGRCRRWPERGLMGHLADGERRGHGVVGAVGVGRRGRRVLGPGLEQASRRDLPLAGAGPCVGRRRHRGRRPSAPRARRSGSLAPRVSAPAASSIRASWQGKGRDRARLAPASLPELVRCRRSRAWIPRRSPPRSRCGTPRRVSCCRADGRPHTPVTPPVGAGPDDVVVRVRGRAWTEPARPTCRPSRSPLSNTGAWSSTRTARSSVRRSSGTTRPPRPTPAGWCPSCPPARRDGRRRAGRCRWPRSRSPSSRGSTAASPSTGVAWPASASPTTG